MEVGWFNLICAGVDRRAHHGIAYTVISVPRLSALPILPNAVESALEGDMGFRIYLLMRRSALCCRSVDGRWDGCRGMRDGSVEGLGQCFEEMRFLCPG